MPHGRRKKKHPVPDLPLKVVVKVGNRIVAEIAFGHKDDPTAIVPGSVVWRCDPAKVSGPDREKAAGYVVKAAKLDPKTDHDRIWEVLWGQAPRRE